MLKRYIFVQTLSDLYVFLRKTISCDLAFKTQGQPVERRISVKSSLDKLSKARGHRKPPRILRHFGEAHPSLDFKDSYFTCERERRRIL